MGKRLGGSRRKTRRKLKKYYRQKGKISLQKYFQPFQIGDKVFIMPEAAQPKNLPHRRYFNKVAVVEKKQGRSYLVGLNVGKHHKQILIHPIHLKKL